MKSFFYKISLLFFVVFFSREGLAKDDYAEDEATQGILKGVLGEEIDHGLMKTFSYFRPKISNKLVADVKFEDNYQSTDRKNEYKETKASARFYSSLKFDHNLAVNAYFKLGQSSQASETARRNVLLTGGGDRSFEDEGISISELNVSYDKKNYVIVAGKFGLNFGTAWRFDRGLWVHDIATNYNQSEKLGFNGIYRLGDAKKNGKYEFAFGAFTNDRKNLDNAIITGRDSYHKYDARAGDTRSLQSYVGSLDVSYDFGEKFNRTERLSYHFAYINLAVNANASSLAATKIADQKGFVFGMNYKRPVMNNFALDGLVEYANMKNYGGDTDITESYFTSSLIARIYQRWSVTLGYASRKDLKVNAAGFDQDFAEISAGYELREVKFFDKLILQAGYKNLRTNYKTSLETQNVLGALIRVYKNF